MSKQKQLEIKVVALTIDCGDGSSMTTLYNDIEELLADHPKADIMTKKLRKEILDGDDYENGTIDCDTIKLVEVDGVLKLAKHIRFGG